VRAAFRLIFLHRQSDKLQHSLIAAMSLGSFALSDNTTLAKMQLRTVLPSTPSAFDNAATTTDVDNGSQFAGPEGVMPLVLPGTEMAVINGYLSTAVALFTIVTNSLVCIVLLKRHMRGSPTNIILVALSISTTLTGVWPIPCNV